MPPARLPGSGGGCYHPQELSDRVPEPFGVPDMNRSRSLFSLATASLCLFLAAPSLSAQNEEFERAARELREALQGGKKKSDVSPELKLARRRWARFQPRIDREVARQDEAVKAGGEALAQAVKEYEKRADSGGDAVDHYLAGRLFGRIADLDKAREHFEQAIRMDPMFYWAWHALGTYYTLRKMWEPGMRHYTEALRMNPGYLPSLRGLALCQGKSGDLEGAGKTLAEILSRDPDDLEANEAMASLLKRQLRYEEAAERYRKVLELDPGHHEAQLDLGLCYERTDRTDKALETYQDLLEKDPSNWRALMRVSQIHHRRGHLHQAADDLEHLVAVLPEDAPVDRAQVQATITRLRTGPKEVQPNPDRKTPEQWTYVMLNSMEKERRLKAARVLLTSPRNQPDLNTAFLKVLVKDKEPEMRALALAWIRKWWPPSELRDPHMMSVFKTLMKLSKDGRVLGQLAWLMALSESQAAVPTLIHTLPRVSDEYAFREMHRALNKLTYAYIEVNLPWDVTFEDMERIKKKWAEWYAENRADYARYEDRER